MPRKIFVAAAIFLLGICATAQAQSYQLESVFVFSRHMNDGTVEGLRHKSLPIFSVQYHPEASPGPRDNMYLFDEFLGLVRGNA